MTSFISGTSVYEQGDEGLVKTYTASPQELADETPEAEDRTPISEAERERLDKATDNTFQSVFGDTDAQSQGERADVFVVPGEWQSPLVKARQRKALMLPPYGQISDLDERISYFMKFDGMPEHVAELGQKARLAVGAATTAHESARHESNRRYASSVTAKDEVVKAIASATAAVGAFEAAARESSDEWFEGLVANVDKQRADALKALRAAEKAYAAFRSTVSTANQLAIETGRWDRSWHSSTIREHDLNVPTSAIRDAIRYLTGDNDFASGAFLSADYGDSFPTHTLEKLKRGAEVSGGGSYAQQVYLRAVNPTDFEARLAVESKHLIPFLNSAPTAPDEVAPGENVAGASRGH